MKIKWLVVGRVCVDYSDLKKKFQKSSIIVKIKSVTLDWLDCHVKKKECGEIVDIFWLRK